MEAVRALEGALAAGGTNEATVESDRAQAVDLLLTCRGKRIQRAMNPQSRDYSRSADIPTLSGVSIGFSIKFGSRTVFRSS